MKDFSKGMSKIQEFIAYYRLKKAISFLPFSLKNKKVLVICCGQGFDSQFLITQGAKVTASDINKNFVLEVRKNCLVEKAIVADAQNLPFKNKEFDVIWVNDGLHHLKNPYQGLKEMNRVAKKAFIFLEAQKTFLTPIFIKLGMMDVYEKEEKNFVYRFSRQEIHDFFNEYRITKYSLYSVWCQNIKWLNNNIYKWFNNGISLFLFKICFSSLNFLFGSLGNALIGVAIKDE